MDRHRIYMLASTPALLMGDSCTSGCIHYCALALVKALTFVISVPFVESLQRFSLKLYRYLWRLIHFPLTLPTVERWQPEVLSFIETKLLGCWWANDRGKWWWHGLKPKYRQWWWEVHGYIHYQSCQGMMNARSETMTSLIGVGMPPRPMGPS